MSLPRRSLLAASLLASALTLSINVVWSALYPRAFTKLPAAEGERLVRSAAWRSEIPRAVGVARHCHFDGDPGEEVGVRGTCVVGPFVIESGSANDRNDESTHWSDELRLPHASFRCNGSDSAYGRSFDRIQRVSIGDVYAFTCGFTPSGSPGDEHHETTLLRAPRWAAPPWVRLAIWLRIEHYGMPLAQAGWSVGSTCAILLALAAWRRRWRRSYTTACSIPWQPAEITPEGILRGSGGEPIPCSIQGLTPGPVLVHLRSRDASQRPYRPLATDVIAARAGTLADVQAELALARRQREVTTCRVLAIANLPLLAAIGWAQLL